MHGPINIRLLVMLSSGIKKMGQAHNLYGKPDRTKPIGRHQRPVQNSTTSKGMANIKEVGWE